MIYINDYTKKNLFCQLGNGDGGHNVSMGYLGPLISHFLPAHCHRLCRLKCNVTDSQFTFWMWVWPTETQSLCFLLSFAFHYLLIFLEHTLRGHLFLVATFFSIFIRWWWQYKNQSLMRLYSLSLIAIKK